MDLGSEISLNFKASIKKKLKESGTYIDDELPEYIMVMIANRRTEYQMKEDLSLFLGEETDTFVTWLFVMLNRLQNASKVEATGSSAKQNKNAQQSLQRSESSEQAQLVSAKVEKAQDIVNRIEIEKDDIVEEAKQKATNKENIRLDLEDDSVSKGEKPRTDNSYDKQKNSKDHLKHRSKSRDRKLKRRHRSRSNSPDRRHSTEHKRSSRQRRRSSDSSKRSRHDSNEQEEKDEANKESRDRIPSQITVHKVRPTLPPTKQATGLLIKRAMQEANVSVVKPRVSAEGNAETEAGQTPANFCIEVNNDRRRMHSKKEIKVEEPQQRYTQEEVNHGNEDANHDNEAVEDNYETGERRPRLVADVEKAQEDGIEVEVPENEFLHEQSALLKNKTDKRIVIAHDFNGESADRLSDNTKDNDVAPESVDLDVVEKEDHEYEDHENEDVGMEKDEDCVAPEKKHENDDNMTDDDRPKKEKRRHRHRREKSSHREKKQSNTRFVVTLHGALDQAVKQDKRRQHSKPYRGRSPAKEDPLFIDMNPKAPMQILESAQQEIDKMAKKLDMMQNLLPTSTIEQYNPSLPAMNTIVPAVASGIHSLHGLSSRPTGLPNTVFPDQFNPAGPVQTTAFVHHPVLSSSIPAPVIVMQNMSDAKLVSKTKLKQREIIVPLRGEKDDEEMSDAESAEEREENKAEEKSFTERCRFWPNCKNASCQYIHPTIPCRMFPNCNFKDKCIFLHPVCRFGNRCTKPVCPYTHTQKPRYALPATVPKIGTSLDAPAPICRFYPNCSKPSCPFRHPSTKACRYASACNRSDCPFHHETRPATGDSLKWSSNAKQPPQHPSERAFAVSQQEVTSAPVKISTA